MNIKKLREKSLNYLKLELLRLLRELFNLRIQAKNNQLTQSHLIRKAKRNIARIKTIIKEKIN